MSASHPNLLGHPLVYHSLSSPRHKSFTVSLETKHSPGNSCKQQKGVRKCYAAYLHTTIFMKTNYLRKSHTITLRYSHRGDSGRNNIKRNCTSAGTPATPSIHRHVPGEASEMYKGEVMEAIPTPRPTKTRPTMRREGPGEAAMITAPMKKRKSAMRIAVRLPYRSFIHPPIAAPIMAPAIAMLTMVSCVMSIPSSPRLQLHFQMREKLTNQISCIGKHTDLNLSGVGWIEI
ncbi:hypothetical protein SDJN02_25293, partial [Cucurbita argyrosperma subsp. argyrosperma]